jgi:hypothetical protein
MFHQNMLLSSPRMCPSGSGLEWEERKRFADDRMAKNLVEGEKVTSQGIPSRLSTGLVHMSREERKVGKGRLWESDHTKGSNLRPNTSCFSPEPCVPQDLPQLNQP